MPTYGPWMDDATPVDRLMLDKRGASSSADTWGWQWAGYGADTADIEGALLDVWTAGDLSISPSGGVRTGELFVGSTTGLPAEASWMVTWVTCNKPAATTATSATPPTGWNSDPNVIGVEWEPTTVVLSQRLEVSVYDTLAAAFDGRPFHVKMVDGLAGRYEPAAEDAGTMAGRTDVATTEDGVADVDSPPITLDPGGAKFAVALLDDFTQLQDTSGATSLFEAGGSFYSTRVRLFYSQRPRYRLIYADVTAAVAVAATPSLRMLQRGGAGGIGGIPRAVGNPTRQASPRRGSGTVL